MCVIGNACGYCCHKDNDDGSIYLAVTQYLNKKCKALNQLHPAQLNLIPLLLVSEEGRGNETKPLEYNIL